MKMHISDNNVRRIEILVDQDETFLYDPEDDNDIGSKLKS